MLRDVFGSAEHQAKATFGLGYRLISTKNLNTAVLNKIVAIAVAEVVFNNIGWYIQHYTPSVSQQGFLTKQILSKTPTELRHIEISVLMKHVNSQNLWTFQLGSQQGKNALIFRFCSF